MINTLGKILAFIQVGFSIMLMAVALALYFNAADFGWEQPVRYWRDVKGKKGENLLVPSLFDKRDAAVRKLVRTERDVLVQLGTAEDQLNSIDSQLAQNHLEGEEVLKNLDKKEGEFVIFDIKLDDKGNLVLKAGSPPQLGFPDLATKVEGINMSVAGYVEKLKDVDARLIKVSQETAALQEKLKKLTAQLTGDVEADGTSVRGKDGAVLEPGWYYLIESEVQTQKELMKEITYIRPLWLKERADAQMVVNRRYDLLRRLGELGDNGFLTQAEFLKKLQ